MAIKLVKEEKAELKEGQHFFAGEGSNLMFCRVTDPKATQAFVLNGKFEVRIESDRKHIKVPYLLSRGPIPILHIGVPEGTDINDPVAVLAWFRHTWHIEEPFHRKG